MLVELLALALLAGCSPKEDQPIPAPVGSRVFVVNEGKFNSNNGTVALFDPTAKTVALDLFGTANGASRKLGDVVQHLAVAGNRGYAVVNNSNKVEVVSLPDFRSVATITGLASPRYFQAVSATRAYVTQWGNYAGTIRADVRVLDLTTNTVVDSIAVGPLPERLLLVGGRVFVVNYGGNTVSVLDPAINRVTATVRVGDAPNSLALDKNNRLWVLCGGEVKYDANYNVDYTTTTAGSLYSLDPANPTATVTARPYLTNVKSPTDLQLNPARDQLYFRAIDAASYLGGVCRLGIADAALPSLTTPFIPGQFYGLGLDPATGIVYVGTGNFAADKIVRYQPGGEKIDEYGVGIGPSGFVFFQ